MITMIITNPNRNEVPGNIRDPMVFLWEDRYYLVATSPAFWTGYTPGVKLWSSDDLVEWKFESLLISADDIPEECNLKERFWAPEILCHNGRFYLTVNGLNSAVGDKLHSYFAVADAVTGPYKLFTKPIVDHPSNDASLFVDDDGKVYVTCSWNDLLMFEIDLETGRAITEPRVIASPGKEGEWDCGPHIEGSFVVKRNGIYYVWYSSPGRGYEMGWYTTDSLDHPFKKYSDEPILSGLGTDFPQAGHNGCFKLRDGRDAVSFHVHDHGGQELLAFDIVTYPMRPRKISTQIEI